MTKAELINKISEYNNVPEEEQKIFFETLLKRCSDVFNPGETLAFPGVINFEYRKALNENENDLIIFKTDNEELPFDIPEKTEDEDSNKSVDSFFSISIGKPIIPLKGEEQNEFYIPDSGDEQNRILLLKVEKFIEEAIEAEEEKSSLSDIQFSFLNWKKSSNLNKDIDQTEKEHEELTSEINDLEKANDNAEEKIKEELSENDNDKIENENDIEVEDDTISEINEELEKTKVDEDPGMISEIKEEEKLTEAEDEWVEDLIDESEDIEEEIIEEEQIITEEDLTISSEMEKEEEVPQYLIGETTAISDAFKYVEERKSRIDNYSKKSLSGFFFAGAILVVIAGVIYFSYYFSESETITEHTFKPKEFRTVIERSYDIPVSYPYRSGMFNEFYNAIDKNILQPDNRDVTEQTSEVGDNNISKVPEIRNPLPATRIKGYIYQYNDGTFAAQVSSWKSRSIAISETQKYLDAGYDAFIEQTTSSNSNYYRVRVGGFNSLSEVENFLKK